MGLSVVMETESNLFKGISSVGSWLAWQQGPCRVMPFMSKCDGSCFVSFHVY